MRLTCARHRKRRFLLLALVPILILLIALLAWLGTPAGDLLPDAETALESSASVRVIREPFIAFEPVNSEITTGFIFYPGARVAPEAYAPLVRALAQDGYLAVIVPMPLNIAILNPDAAIAVIEAYKQINTWVIGGHSLGGVMAARYAQGNPGRIADLVLLAAYPEAQIDLSQHDLAVATIYGDHDGLVSLEEIESSFQLLPTTAVKLMLAGGNHAQFGSYGDQAGDQSALISREEQQAQVHAAIAQLMSQAGK